MARLRLIALSIALSACASASSKGPTPATSTTLESLDDPSPRAPERSPSLSLLIVLDRSSTRCGPAGLPAKLGIISAIASLPDSVDVGVVVAHADELRIVVELGPAVDPDAVERAVMDAPCTNAPTLGELFRMAREHLAKVGEGPTHILLVTDRPQRDAWVGRQRHLLQAPASSASTVSMERMPQYGKKGGWHWKIPPRKPSVPIRIKREALYILAEHGLPGGLARPAPPPRTQRPQITREPIEFPPFSPPRIDAPPISLMLVMDCSGSMSGDKLEAAKRAAMAAIKAAPRGSHIGIVPFHMAPGAPLPLARRKDPATATEFVKTLGAAGGSDLRGALDMAFDLLAAHPEPTVKRMLILTDSHLPRDRLLSRFRGVAKSGIRASIIGVGEVDQEMLRSVASVPGIRTPAGPSSLVRLPQVAASELELLITAY